MLAILTQLLAETIDTLFSVILSILLEKKMRLVIISCNSYEIEI